METAVRVTKPIIFGWLGGYAAFLDPVAGIMICDYFVIRRRVLLVDDLYLRGGAYEYSRGFNWLAIAALAAGAGTALVGLVVPSLRTLYDYSWFVGFAVSFVAYYALMKCGENPEYERRRNCVQRKRRFSSYSDGAPWTRQSTLPFVTSAPNSCVPEDFVARTVGRQLCLRTYAWYSVIQRAQLPSTSDGIMVWSPSLGRVVQMSLAQSRGYTVRIVAKIPIAYYRRMSTMRLRSAVNLGAAAGSRGLEMTVHIGIHAACIRSDRVT